MSHLKYIGQLSTSAGKIKMTQGSTSIRGKLREVESENQSLYKEVKVRAEDHLTASRDRAESQETINLALKRIDQEVEAKSQS